MKKKSEGKQGGLGDHQGVTLSQLSPTGDRYVGIFRRNQFKVFDSKTKVLLLSHVDKSEVYVACEWTALTDGSEILFLGCQSGRILAFDVTGGRADLLFKSSALIQVRGNPNGCFIFWICMICFGALI